MSAPPPRALVRCLVQFSVRRRARLYSFAGNCTRLPPKEIRRMEKTQQHSRLTSVRAVDTNDWPLRHCFFSNFIFISHNFPQIDIVFYSRVWPSMPAVVPFVFAVNLWDSLPVPTSQICDIISNHQHPLSFIFYLVVVYYGSISDNIAQVFWEPCSLWYA